MKEHAYCEGAVVGMFVVRAGHRRIQTVRELEEVVNESERGLLALRVWIHEGLHHEVGD